MTSVVTELHSKSENLGGENYWEVVGSLLYALESDYWNCSGKVYSYLIQARVTCQKETLTEKNTSIRLSCRQACKVFS